MNPGVKAYFHIFADDFNTREGFFEGNLIQR